MLLRSGFRQKELGGTSEETTLPVSRADASQGSEGGPVIRVLNRTPVALAIVLIATLLPRVVALDRFVTPDEYLWVTRSANFYCAVSQGDWKNTFQRQHPGVTTTWAGTLAFLAVVPDYADDCRQIAPAEHEQVLRAHGIDPLRLLQAGRLVMVLFNTGALTIAFLYARTLIGPLPALIGFTLIAFDPFHLALSRLLHLDGLLGSLMLLAMLACGSYLRRRRASDLIVSGIATGLSCLTKSPGILLIPFVALAGILSYWRTRRTTPVAARGLVGHCGSGNVRGVLAGHVGRAGQHGPSRCRPGRGVLGNGAHQPGVLCRHAPRGRQDRPGCVLFLPAHLPVAQHAGRSAGNTGGDACPGLPA